MLDGMSHPSSPPVDHITHPFILMRRYRIDSKISRNIIFLAEIRTMNFQLAFLTETVKGYFHESQRQQVATFTCCCIQPPNNNGYKFLPGRSASTIVYTYMPFIGKQIIKFNPITSYPQRHKKIIIYVLLSFVTIQSSKEKQMQD